MTGRTGGTGRPGRYRSARFYRERATQFLPGAGVLGHARGCPVRRVPQAPQIANFTPKYATRAPFRGRGPLRILRKATPIAATFASVATSASSASAASQHRGRESLRLKTQFPHPSPKPRRRTRNETPSLVRPHAACIVGPGVARRRRCGPATGFGFRPDCDAVPRQLPPSVSTRAAPTPARAASPCRCEFGIEIRNQSPGQCPARREAPDQGARPRVGPVARAGARPGPVARPDPSAGCGLCAVRTGFS